MSLASKVDMDQLLFFFFFFSELFSQGPWTKSFQLHLLDSNKHDIDRQVEYRYGISPSSLGFKVVTRGLPYRFRHLALVCIGWFTRVCGKFLFRVLPKEWAVYVCLSVY